LILGYKQLKQLNMAVDREASGKTTGNPMAFEWECTSVSGGVSTVDGTIKFNTDTAASVASCFINKTSLTIDTALLMGDCKYMMVREVESTKAELYEMVGVIASPAYYTLTLSNFAGGDIGTYVVGRNYNISFLTDGTIPTGLEIITEEGNTGWRLIGKDPANYRDIGDGAVDLSQSQFGPSSVGPIGAEGDRSHAEGSDTNAIGDASHAEGGRTHAEGFASHTEGIGTQAFGNASHAEGSSTRAFASGGHAQGNQTITTGLYSHSGGKGATNVYVKAAGYGAFNHSSISASDGTQQEETITCTNGATSAGNITMTITADGMVGSPVSVVVPIAVTDTTPTLAAIAIKAALSFDIYVASFLIPSETTGDIELKAIQSAANDATMAFSFVDTDATGVTFGASTNTTAGIAPATLGAVGDYSAILGGLDNTVTGEGSVALGGDSQNIATDNTIGLSEMFKLKPKTSDPAGMVAGDVGSVYLYVTGGVYSLKVWTGSVWQAL
jgi:hypothetical protein